MAMGGGDALGLQTRHPRHLEGIFVRLRDTGAGLGGVDIRRGGWGKIGVGSRRPEGVPYCWISTSATTGRNAGNEMRSR